MSRDVGCWCGPEESVIRMFVFKVLWFEFRIMSAERLPQWSLYGDYHVFHCAYMSPVTMLFFTCVGWLKVFVMS